MTYEQERETKIIRQLESLKYAIPVEFYDFILNWNDYAKRSKFAYDLASSVENRYAKICGYCDPILEKIQTTELNKSYFLELSARLKHVKNFYKPRTRK